MLLVYSQFPDNPSPEPGHNQTDPRRHYPVYRFPQRNIGD
jgi:hypothetical protein